MPDLFVEAARQWLGTPWVNGGRAKGVGVSCTGLLIMAAREVGLAVDDIPVDEARASGRDLRRHLAKYCDPLPMDRARHGAVVLMYGARPRTGETSLPTHIGILCRPAPAAAPAQTADGRLSLTTPPALGGWSVIHVPRFVSGKTGHCVETGFDPEQHGARGLYWPRAFESVGVGLRPTPTNAAVVSGV